MGFPNQKMTWKVQRTGLSDVIALPEKGHPYTLSIDKQSGGYVAGVFTSTDPNPTDGSETTWVFIPTIRALDSVDVTSVVIPATARALVVRVDSITEANPAKNPLRITIETQQAAGANNKRYSAVRSQGILNIQDDYVAMVLGDMVDGMFFPCQDGIIEPLTDLGNIGITDFNTTDTPTDVLGPFGTMRAFNSTAGHDYRTSSLGGWADGTTPIAWEMWYRAQGAYTTAMNLGGSPRDTLTQYMHLDETYGKITLRLNHTQADPGAWAPSTAYVVGDRRRPTAGGNTQECVRAGTSSGTEPAVWGTGNDTHTSDGADVVWQHVANVNGFHGVTITGSTGLEGGSTPRINRWNHVAIVHRANAQVQMFVNGAIHSSAFRIDAHPEVVPNTVAGSFGSPVRDGLGVAWQGDELTIGCDRPADADPLTGDVSLIAYYRHELTEAQIIAHYETGVALGLND